MTDFLEFRVSSGLKDIIGKDLITDDFIAVFELVKNSYDAKARNVIITIEDDKIIIADDGKGMSLDDLKEKWLFVAFSAKRDGTEDIELNIEEKSYRDKIQAKYHYAGSKGIGRFSCDRLGQFLSLKTQIKDCLLVEEINVDWSKFEEDQRVVFQNIKVNHNTFQNGIVQFPYNSLNGTILEITGVYSIWNRERLKQLKHSLEKLINPFSETNEFNIEIICERELEEDNLTDKSGRPKYIERDQLNGKVLNSILEILNIKTTQISVEINSEFIITKIFDRGASIYHIKEKNRDLLLLSGVKIDLYFLNNSAKNNFTRKMGVQPVNFGSVFLFKNGFRVQPFGEPGDDSWGLDYRAQQGYNRFLGTRDLFGRVEITTNNTDQFKEVSSRDGGLVETFGYHLLMKTFKEKALVRLERYVVGVLWGEGFKKKKYFGEGDEANLIAEGYRKELQKYDKISDNFSFATSNLGSKIDFIQIIKNLSSNEDIDIVDFNREFIDLVNERLDEVDSKYIADLETIAIKTNDKNLKREILEVEKRYKELIVAKEEAEKKLFEEVQKRILAEERAKKEIEARLKAEKKQKEEEEKRRKAELDTLKKENERVEAELAMFHAERKAKEEEERRLIEEKARKAAEKTAELNREKFEIEKRKTVYLQVAEKDNISKDTETLIHSIKDASSEINASIDHIHRIITANNYNDDELLKYLGRIESQNKKTHMLAKLITHSDLWEEKMFINVPDYIIDYIQINNIFEKPIKIKYAVDKIFNAKINLIDVGIAIDELLMNAKKAGAKEMSVQINVDKFCEILFIDNGKGISDAFIDKPNRIFELGVSNTNGSGMGLYNIQRILKESCAFLTFEGNRQDNQHGAIFKIKFK